MKKSLSKLNLLHKKIEGIELKGVWKWLDPGYSFIEIMLPYYDYLRADVFVSDIKMFEPDSDIDVGQLVAMVYLQFVLDIRRGEKYSDLNTLANYLMSLKEQYISSTSKTETIEELLQQDENTWALRPVSKKLQKTDRYADIKLRIKSSEIYRTEILLHDLMEIEPSFNLTTEDLITVMFLRYIKQLKENGNNSTTMRQAVQAYEFYCDKGIL